ncbi:MAG: DUF4384 domain-containing protein [Thiohalomonadales bacterium]
MADSSVANSLVAEKAFRVEITTHLGDQQEYIDGDEISFLLNINRDAYLLILYKDTTQDLWQLLPNDFNRQSKFKAGMYIPIPGTEQSYRFRASAPFGRETLFAYAADTPFPPLPSKISKNGIQLLDTTIEKLEKILHDSAFDIKNNMAKSTLDITTQKRP